ncbi:MAG: NAD-dependent epimerase/dehydratase family protein [Verrucomicrobiota bacterium]
MKILVTGGAGFIGSHVVEHFQGRAKVVVLDNLATGYRKNLAGLEHDFIEGSITDVDAVRSAMEGVDYVFHLAAMVSVPLSMERPKECVETNVLGLLNVLEQASQAGVRKLVHASSAAVYGDASEAPKDEGMLPDPRSPYAVSKLDGEYYLEMFRRDWGLATASVRLFNVFGNRQDPDGAYAAAVPIFIKKALSNEPLTIFGDGEQTRDFVHVTDVVRALEHLVTHPELHGAYNVGYGGSMTIAHLAREIIRLSGSSSEIRHEAVRAGDVKCSEAVIDRLRSTGFEPAGSLEKGLGLTLGQMREDARD